MVNLALWNSSADFAWSFGDIFKEGVKRHRRLLVFVALQADSYEIMAHGLDAEKDKTAYKYNEHTLRKCIHREANSL